MLYNVRNPKLKKQLDIMFYNNKPIFEGKYRFMMY